MSLIQRLKSQVRDRQGGGGGSYPSSSVNVVGGSAEPMILPEKPKKRRKIMEVQKESKYTMACLDKNKSLQDQQGGGGGGCVPMDEDEAEEDEEKEAENHKDPKKVPWGPPELLQNLKQPGAVENINAVIQLLKKTSDDDFSEKGKREKDKNGQPVEIVWDHSETPIGRKSDNNFFLWMEAMAANEARKVMEKENLIFE